MNIKRNDFKDFVVNEGLSENTANNYASGVERVCDNEGCTWDDLKKSIDTILPVYSTGGVKEAVGKELNGAVICGLKKYKKFASYVHDWTFAEDFICCVLYIKTYLIDRNAIHIDKLVKQAMPFLTGIPTLSVKEKFRNIKQITIDMGLVDACIHSPRPHASTQNRKAFERAYALMI